eukprot:SAG22_NODE_1967_length_3237_cov_1.563416_6_plen_104_part_00
MADSCRAAAQRTWPAGLRGRAVAAKSRSPSGEPSALIAPTWAFFAAAACSAPCCGAARQRRWKEGTQQVALNESSTSQEASKRQDGSGGHDRGGGRKELNQSL